MKIAMKRHHGMFIVTSRRLLFRAQIQRCLPTGTSEACAQSLQVRGASWKACRRVDADFVRLTALSLTCAAKAHVPKPRGTAVAMHTAGQQRVSCNCRDAPLVLCGRGASAP